MSQRFASSRGQTFLVPERSSSCTRRPRATAGSGGAQSRMDPIHMSACMSARCCAARCGAQTPRRASGATKPESTLHKATLPSCLSQYQFYVDTKNKKLNLQIYLRSSDFFLANNWNTCTGALFMHLICNLVDIDLTPGILTVVTGDTHLYNNHLDQVKENLERIPRPFPKLIIKKELDNIENFSWEDIKLIDYNPYPNIKALMAV